MKKVVRNTVVALVVISVVGCAASGDKTAGGGSDECSSLKTGAAGMLIGAAIGAAINGSKGAAQGAAAGAVVGAIGCMTMNYKSKKVRSAEVVNDDYIRDHKQLPATPVVTAYELSAPRSVVRGNAVNVNSAMTVVDGQSQPIRSIEEKLFIVSPDGRRKALKTKAPMSLNGGGEYNNSFSFSPPAGAPEGSYRLESELYVNEKMADKSSTSMQFAYSATNNTMTLALLQ